MGARFEHFRTLEELTNTIESRPYNEVFFSREKMSEKVVYENDHFYGCQSYEIASDLLKNGFKEPLEQLKKDVLNINKQVVQFKEKPFLDVVGYAPHIPNAIMGLPNSMYNKVNKPEVAKTLHLKYGFSAVANVRAKDLLKGGTMFVALVNSLELQGYRIKIDVVRCTTSSTTNAIGYTCTLKEYNQQLNLLKLCYPLAHPSMLRRTSFRWCETFPNLTDKGYTGYGASLVARLRHDNDAEKAFLRKHGVLKGKYEYYCNVYEAMKSKTVQELADKMGLFQ
jgi:ssDNA-binding Zn-finger/Zn-ribbon topoisomerase 1